MYSNCLQWEIILLAFHYLPLLLLDLSDNAAATPSSSPGLVTLFGDANNDSSWRKQARCNSSERFLLLHVIAQLILSEKNSHYL